MRKFLLYSSALVAFTMSGVAEAACIQTPNCTTLGYTSTTACEGGLKCPWGNAWFCNVGGGSSTPDYSNCKIGDILYSDMTCNANVVASKTPIGVVFDTTNHLAVGLAKSREYWSMDGFDVPALENISSVVIAKADWQGRNNTKVVLEYCKSKGNSCPAFEYVNSYKTDGTKEGDWYLPAAGELNAIYENVGVLNIALEKIGGEQFEPVYYYWSSTEVSAENAWRMDFCDDNYCIGGSKGLESSEKYYKGLQADFYVRPVLKFPVSSNSRIL